MERQEERGGTTRAQDVRIASSIGTMPIAHIASPKPSQQLTHTHTHRRQKRNSVEN